jgi:predicted AAA+ superfamily ATPase
MIARNLYIKQLELFINKPFIKILTGIRRCGKSAVLHLLQDNLLAKGVSQQQMIFLLNNQY